MGSQYEAMGDIKSDYVIPIKPLRIRQTPAPIHVSPRPMKLQSKNSEVFTPRNDSREYKSADPSASELITGETVLEIEDEDKFIVENRNNSAPPRRGKKPSKSGRICIQIAGVTLIVSVIVFCVALIGILFKWQV